MNIVVEDHAVPQLLTSALEAYDFGKSSGRRYQDKLETFGLLTRTEKYPDFEVSAR